MELKEWNGPGYLGLDDMSIGWIPTPCKCFWARAVVKAGPG
jgi:hypothetical protein